MNMFCEQNKEKPSKNEIIRLIQKARDGSVESLRQLKLKYLPLINSQVSSHFVDCMSRQDVNDLREEAISAFCDAVCSYRCDDDKVDFGLYAKICINNRLITFLRAYSSRSKRNLNFVADINEAGIQCVSVDPLQKVIEEEKVQMLIDVIEKSLSPFEARVWWLYVSGMSTKDISRSVNSENEKSVSNAIYRIRKKLRKLLTD